MRLGAVCAGRTGGVRGRRRRLWSHAASLGRVDLHVTADLRPGTIPRMNYWLAKSEPEAYAWAQLIQDGKTAWTGVRNFQARNNLRAMKKGDVVFFYHSVTDKQVVGVAMVVKEFYPDATATEGDWSCVDIAPVKALKAPVRLETIKADKILKEMPLVKQSRLSVTPLTEAQANRVLELGATKL
jgi:predicted RNA-binding protein with PUA-like domain